MNFTTLTTAAALILASTAASMPSLAARQVQGAVYATVVAIDNDIHSGTGKETPVQVSLGFLTHHDTTMTDLRLDSVTSNVGGVEAPDIQRVSCQRYKDQYGVQPGSIAFTKDNEAKISTNHVDFGWVLCRVNAST